MTFYGALLRLYPHSFRAEYATELERTFEDRMDGHGVLVRFVAALADVLPNAIAAHWSILLQDLRYTLRSLNRARGFTLTAVLVTALGVGANTASFSVADFVLLRAMPYPDDQRLVRLCEGPRTGGGLGCMNDMSPANARDVKTANMSFEAFGVFTSDWANLTGSGDPIRLNGVDVTSEVLPLMGVPPVIGRVFDTTLAGRGEAGSVVISYGLWDRFGKDRDILGRSIVLNGRPFRVIGVMPPAFNFPTRDLAFWSLLQFTENDYSDRGNTYLQGVARLKPTVSFEQARADLDAIADRISRDNPGNEIGFSFYKQRDGAAPSYQTMLLSLCGASACMLLLACANLANLLIVRASARERELAVRAAIGAGRDRLVRQMLTESLVLAFAGGIVGVLIARWTVPLLAYLVPSSLPIARQPILDLRILGVAGLLVLLTGIGFGLLPALRAGGRTGFDALRASARAGGSRTQRLRAGLVTFEVAVSVLLLIASGLLVRAIWKVQSVDPGFSTERVLKARVELPRPKYDSLSARLQFYDRLITEVRALPGVNSAALTSGVPMVFWGGVTGIQIPGVETGTGVAARRDPSQNALIRYVTPGFFATMGIARHRGRDLDRGDVAGALPVAVVSESFAQRYWPGEDPIGQTFRSFQNLKEDRTVVGVVGDVRVRGLERTAEPQIYLPAAQAPVGLPDFYMPKDLVVRSSLPEASLAPAITRMVQTADPEQPVSDVRPLSEVVSDQTASRRAQVQVLGALAALALLLAGIGIHGLLSLAVTQRVPEIGVRLALGASPWNVGRMILAEATRLAVIGLVVGTLGAYVAAKGMSALLFGVAPDDPVTFGVAFLLVLFVTAAGMVAPMLRAMRVNPSVVIRTE